jgi:hypothetical protein
MSYQALKACRCGSQPRIARMEIPPGDAWAVHCRDFCGDDTHWQNTLEKASELWNAGQVRNQRGGQGEATDSDGAVR